MCRVYARRVLGIVSGSGAVVRGGVLTAHHVLRDSTYVWVVLKDGRRFDAVGWSRCGKQDAALIRFGADLPAPPLPIASEEVTQPARIVVIGYWGRGFEDGELLRTEAVVYPSVAAPDQLVRAQGGTFYGVTVPMMPGLSGAPCIVHGLIVAVASAAPADGFGSGYCYAARVTRSQVYD